MNFGQYLLTLELHLGADVGLFGMALKSDVGQAIRHVAILSPYSFCIRLFISIAL